jgi:hypothetical protein
MTGVTLDWVGAGGVGGTKMFTNVYVPEVEGGAACILLPPKDVPSFKFFS